MWCQNDQEKGVVGHFHALLHRAHFCLAVCQRSGNKHFTRILNVLISGAVMSHPENSKVVLGEEYNGVSSKGGIILTCS